MAPPRRSILAICWSETWRDRTLSLPMFVTLVIISCILTAAIPVDNTPSCKVPRKDYFAVIFVGAFATGCLVMLIVALVNVDSLRRNFLATYAAVFVLANCAFHFIYVSQGLAPYICVRSLGGLSALSRPQMPQHNLFWICSTGTILMALSRVINLPQATQLTATALILVMLIAGTVSTYTENFPLWATMLAICCILHVGLLAYMVALFRAAWAKSKDTFTRRIFYWVAPLSCANWCLFPLVWGLGQWSVISPDQEWTIWPGVDFVFKAAVAVPLVLGSFHQQAVDTHADLDLAEDRRVQAQATKDDVSRQFLRWTLHELRVPLQGAMLALEEIQDGLEAGVLTVAAAAPPTANRNRPAARHNAPVQTAESFREAGSLAVGAIVTVSKLLDNFLSLSKIEDGRMELEPVPLNVRPWLAEVASSFTNALRGKGLTLHSSVDDDIPLVILADGNRLRQVVTNYLSNAIKFSPATGGGALQLRAERVFRLPTLVLEATKGGGGTGTSSGGGGGAQQQPRLRARSTAAAAVAARGAAEPASAAVGVDGSGSLDGALAPAPAPSSSPSAAPFLRVTVEDCGPGLAADEITQLFQPYKQIRAGAMQNGGGTGLGLALCKKIVELAGGAVGVSSEPGKGASFWFEVPMVLAPVVPPLADRSCGSSPASSDATGGHHRRGSNQPLIQIGGGGRTSPSSPLDQVSHHTPLAVNTPVAGGGASSVRINVAPEPPPQLLLPSNFAAAGAAAGDASGATELRRASLPPLRPAAARAVPAMPGLCIRLPGEVGDTDSARSPAICAPDAGLSPMAAGPAEANDGSALRLATRVVVVDDVFTNREMFARLLRRNGCDVVFTAEHGQDCLDKAAALLERTSAAAAAAAPTGGLDTLVDIWFVDGIMPVMDGLELTRLLRGGCSVRAPIVAITGGALDKDRDQFLAAGAVAVLAKPVLKLRDQLAAVGLRLPTA